jgi:type IV pilus assembly protein PilV
MTRPVQALARSRRGAGFTLVEVLLALAIFATGMLALALCVPLATKRVMRSGAQTRSSSLAAETAEELLTVPYGDGSLTPGAHLDAANPHDGVYFVRWLVEDDAPLAHCKRITVMVARHSAAAVPEASIVIVTPQSGG